MVKHNVVTTTAGDLARQLSRYCDIALSKPVNITKNGRRRNVLISAEEYDRLKRRDQQAFMAADAPEELVSDLKAYLRNRKR